MMMRRHRLSTVLGIVASGALAATALGVGSDNFDSYASPTNLLGNGNGQISYFTPSPSGSPITGTSELTAITDGTAPSPSNVMKYADNADNFGCFNARLAPGSAIDLSAVGSTAKIEFDFKVTSGWTGAGYGPGGRASATIRAMWGLDANAGGEDWIDSTHNAGISDGGLYFLNNANVLGALTNRYQSGEWYHWDMSLTRRGDGGIDYVLDVRRKSDNFSLDGPIASVANSTGARVWLTGLGYYGSSNQQETVLFDNLQFTPEPASALLLVAGATLAVRRRRLA